MYDQIASNKRRTVILVVLFVLVISIVGWLIGQLTNSGNAILAFAVLLSLTMSTIGYFQGDKIALAMAGAKPIKKEDNPYVYRLVENLSITAGTPVPKIYIINDPALNAFATGRKPDLASIALTTGIIDKLQNEELEGVIAHELSHIKNYDIRLMTVVIVLVGIVIYLADFTFRGRIFGGKRNEKDNGLLQIIGIITIILAPIIAKLIQLAISRKRELLADASGALLTRYPEGLASALEKINQSNIPLQKANNAMAHLYIANPFAGKKNFLTNLFSTHPPIEERIKLLREMT